MDIHERYLGSLVGLALADGIVSEAERADLVLVADLLGVGRGRLDELIAKGGAPLAASPPRTESLSGKSVCFTGANSVIIDGERLSRERAEELSAKAGLVVQQNVTKKLDILVVSDPDSQSGKARKARDYGTRIMAERAFWAAIGVETD